MSQINILIVEDEFIIAEDLKESLTGLGYHVMAVVDNFDDAVQHMESNQPDIAIVDIMIKGDKTGIDLGMFIRKNYKFPFLFLSSHADSKTVSEAKRCKPDAYLVKPFKEKEIFSSIEIAMSNFAQGASNHEEQKEIENVVIKDSIFIKKDSFFTKVRLANILFIKSEGNYLELFVDGKKRFVIRSTLKDLLTHLPEDKFLQTHKSYVINIEFIDLIAHTFIQIGDHEVPISKHRKEEVMRMMKMFS
ncbi:MAG: response regulator [Desulfobacterales bacterium]|nr:response regulator [Desulfobacterales bacterium]